MSILHQIRPRYVSDGTGPSTPGTPVRVGVTTPTGFTITWAPASDISGVLGYRVYLAIDPGTPARISAAQTDTVACAWTFSNLNPNTIYRVQVDAIDVFGNASSRSGILSQGTNPEVAGSIYADDSNAIGYYLQGNTAGGGVQDNAQARIDASQADWIMLQWKWPSAFAAEDAYIAQMEALNPTQIRLIYVDFRYYFDDAQSDFSDATTRCVWKALNSNGAPDIWKARNAAGQHLAHIWSPNNTLAVNWASTALNAEGKNIANAVWDRFLEMFQTHLYDGVFFDDVNIRPNSLLVRGSPPGTHVDWDYDRDGFDNSYRTDEVFGAAWMAGITTQQSVGRARRPNWFVSTNSDVAFFGRQNDAGGNYGPLSNTPFFEIDDLSCQENAFWFGAGWGWETQNNNFVPIMSFFSVPDLFMSFELYRLKSRPAATNLAGRRFAFMNQQMGLSPTEVPSQLSIAYARACWATEKLAPGIHYGNVRNSQAPFFLDETCLNLGAPIGAHSMGTLDMTVMPFSFVLRPPNQTSGSASFYWQEYENAIVVWRRDTTGIVIGGGQFGQGTPVSYTLPSAGVGKKWQRPNAASYANPLRPARAMRNQTPALNNGADATTGSLLPLYGEVFRRVDGAVNQPPAWGGAPSPSFVIGTPSSFPLSSLVSDPEGDPITLSSIGAALPSGVTINNATLALDYNGGGTAAITAGPQLRATATGGSADSAPFSIQIASTPLVLAAQPNMWPAAQSSGSIDIELVPAQTISGTQPIAFGVPMPRGWLTNIANCRIETTGGVEIPADVSTLCQWRHLTDPAIDGQSIRSVFVVFNRAVTLNTPQTVRFAWGPSVSRTQTAGLGITPANVHASAAWHGKAAPRSDEHPQTDGYERDTARNLATFPLQPSEMDAQDIMEPKVFAAVPKSHLQACNLRGIAREHDNADWMRYLLGFSRTAVNDPWLTATAFDGEIVPGLGTTNAGSLADWRLADSRGFEPWLYDRTGALANVYAITGNVKWLRHAHRAVQYFREYLRFPGKLDLSPTSQFVRGAFSKRLLRDAWDSGDPKYLSTAGMTMVYLLTGDARLVDKIRDISAFFEITTTIYHRRQPPHEFNLGGIYTERQLATILSSALTAYEVTGEQVYKARAIAIFQGYRQDQVSPPAGYPTGTGWLFHDAKYVGGPVTFPLTFWASCWMSAVLLESVWRYFLMSADEDALRFISDMGEAIARDGTYTGMINTNPPPDGTGASELHRAVWNGRMGTVGSIVGSATGIWTDVEHTPETVTALLRAKWCNQRLGRSSATIDGVLPQLRQTTLWTLGSWRRTFTGLPEYRLAPKRKYNWWFGDNYDEQWLLDETGTP